MCILPLHNLNMQEVQTYLTNRMVPVDQHQSVLIFTWASACPFAHCRCVRTTQQDTVPAGGCPDIIKTLLEQLVQQVPSPAHRAAREVCTLVRLTTEPILAATLTMPDVPELFTWLRSLSFIEVGRQGLFPHDLVREARDADLRWRNPDWYADYMGAPAPTIASASRRSPCSINSASWLTTSFCIAIIQWYVHFSNGKLAELLDIPFSTFRCHLKTGIIRITDILWQWEMHGS